MDDKYLVGRERKQKKVPGFPKLPKIESVYWLLRA